MSSFVEENTKAYDEAASDWDCQVLGSPFYLNERQLAFELLDQHIGTAKPGQTVLDVGCGTGEYTLRLLEQGYAVTALDISPEMLRLTRAKAHRYKERLSLVQVDANDLRGLQGPYDYIVSFGSVVNHIEDWPRSFRNFHRLLKPGGLLIFDVDNILGIDYLFLTLYSRIFR